MITRPESPSTLEVLGFLTPRINSMAKLLKVDTEALDYGDKLEVRGLWILDQFLFDTNREDVCERAYAGLARAIAMEYALAERGASFLDLSDQGAASKTGAPERIKVGSTEVSFGSAAESGAGKAEAEAFADLALEAHGLYRKLVQGCRKMPRPKAGEFWYGTY